MTTYPDTETDEAWSEFARRKTLDEAQWHSMKFAAAWTTSDAIGLLISPITQKRRDSAVRLENEAVARLAPKGSSVKGGTP